MEGDFKQNVVDELDIKAMPKSMQGDMTAVLNWAYAVLNEAYDPKNRRE